MLRCAALPNRVVLSTTRRGVECFAKKQVKKRNSRKRAPELQEEEYYEYETLPPPVVLRAAPSPSDTPPEEDDMKDHQGPGPVFYDRSKPERQPILANPEAISEPLWNPRTGFQTLNTSKAEAAPTSRPQPTPSAPQGESGALPSVSRDAIVGSCVKSGAGFAVLALVLRTYAERNIVEGTSAGLVLQDLLSVPRGFSGPEDMLTMLAAVGLVTGARLALMRLWPDFRDSTNRSNQQVLQPLGMWDVVLVAVVSGLSEELLFRGALVPATLPDWRGTVFASVVFGVLHNSGGRNWSYAVWASAVGGVYGAAYLLTSNIWVPAVAHSLANLLAATVWLQQNQPKKLKS